MTQQNDNESEIKVNKEKSTSRNLPPSVQLENEPKKSKKKYDSQTKQMTKRSIKKMSAEDKALMQQVFYFSILYN